MIRWNDLSGMVFGNWVVERGPIFDEKRKVRWACKCVCGEVRDVMAQSLVSGASTSCGCVHQESHGMSGSRVYKVWASMKRRCLNEGDRYYSNYGGRGIGVCDRWMSFSNFINDMGLPPKGCDLDRIDNNGNYSPENCRWATRRDNMNNRRNNVRLTVDGVTRTASEWEEHYGVPQDVIRLRVNRYGWGDSDAVKIPVGAKRTSSSVRT